MVVVVGVSPCEHYGGSGGSGGFWSGLVNVIPDSEIAIYVALGVAQNQMLKVDSLLLVVAWWWLLIFFS